MAPAKVDFPALTDSEKKLIECIGTEQVDGIKKLLAEKDVKTDCLDDHGMTPLMHAAYKGSKEVCELLLNHGADVNSRYHDHGYSTLMFAALSGNTEVTQLMLEAGANVGHENSVGRNAAQMAAFVGQHQCVSVINNFFSKEDLEYYCSPRGVETEPKLPPPLCSPLYKLIITHNLHPVKLSMVLQQSPELLNESTKVARVLDLLVEKMMKQSRTNEIMAMKFHYLSTVVRHCEKWRSEHDGSLDGWIKLLVKGRPSDGALETQEKFVRSTLKSFPYVDSQLLQQMVRTVAPVDIGGAPTALSVLNSGINGQRFASEEDNLCSTCGTFKAAKKCSACKMVSYCDQKCQKLDWSTHKRFCKELNEQRIQNEERKKKEEEADKLRAEEEKKKQAEAEQAKSEPQPSETQAEAESQPSNTQETTTSQNGDSSGEGKDSQTDETQQAKTSPEP